MRVQIERRKVRIPEPVANGIITSWTDEQETRVYNNQLAVHPCINHQKQGLWTVTHAGTGMGIIHLQTGKEAECFALEMLKDLDGRGMGTFLDFDQQSGGVTREVREYISRFIIGWRERRRLALPRYEGMTAERMIQLAKW